MYNEQPRIPVFSGPDSSVKIVVTRLVFKEESNYGDMYRRPFKVGAVNGVAETIANIVSRTTKPHPVLYAKVGHELLVPSDRGQRAEIVNGWDARRLRFMMYVEATRQNSTQFFTFTGFTDRDGTAPLMRNGLLIAGSSEITMDDDMILYVTNVFQTRSRPRNMAGGYESGYSNPGWVHRSQLLSGDHTDSFDRNNFYSMLPHQIAAAIDGDTWASNPDPSASRREADHYDDRRYNITSRPVLGDRTLSNPARYVSDLVSTLGILASDRDSEDGQIYSQAWAKGAQDSASVRNNPFLAAIGRVAGGSPFSGGSFTYADLLEVDPGVDEIFEKVQCDTIRDPSRAMASDYLNGSNTEGWGPSGIEQIAATSILSGVTGIMMEFGADYMVFKADNCSPGGEMLVHPIRCLGMGGPLPKDFVFQLCGRLEQEVFVPVTHGNEVPFEGDFEIEINGKSTLDFSFDDRNKTPFVSANFADSLFSPFVTNNEADIRTMARGVRDVFDEVFETNVETNYPSTGMAGLR